MSTTNYSPLYDTKKKSSESYQSPLETMPLELLQKIFFESQNCDLPLVSRNLLSTLSFASTKRQMAINMMSTNDAAVQTLLFRRRFFDLALFDSVARELATACAPGTFGCSNGYGNSLGADIGPIPHFRLACKGLFDDPVVSDRLLRSLRIEPHRDADGNAEYNHLASFKKDRHNTPCRKFLIIPADPTQEQFWKIKMVKRLIVGGVRFSKDPAFQQQGSVAKIAAVKGLLEAVQSRNVDAVAFFCGAISSHGRFIFRYSLNFWPDLKTLTTAVITSQNNSKDIIYILFVSARSYKAPRLPRYLPRHAKDLERWIKERKESDEDNRKDKSKDLTNSENDSYWVGDWVEQLWKQLNRTGLGSPSLTYKQFLESRP
ncbi:MAG: hypothetical protein M1829_003672 [Trizodia sp. TS-e1964]|nr:MAG: hypothetical protein M1829_003672 [Trizodia sp. TS-e1964]